MIYRLIDDHKLSLDTTIGKALSYIPMLAVYRNVTVAQLLQFKGGISPYLLIDPSLTPEVFDSRGTAEAQRKRFVARVLQKPPVGAPGASVYSNASYAVAAYIASAVTGESWERLITEEVLAPLHMSETGFGRPRTSQRTDAPSGHQLIGNSWRPEPEGYVHPASLSAAGDMNASISDFGKLASEELCIARGQSRLFSVKTAELLWRTSGLPPGVTLLGGAGAFTAGITVWPDANLRP
jgi:CubicO group peptidase (beta-lactamase class C family)